MTRLPWILPEPAADAIRGRANANLTHATGAHTHVHVSVLSNAFTPRPLELTTDAPFTVHHSATPCGTHNR